ncbi:MAG: hypothetical protein QG657_3870, partial [Acidobacteriota bacterium]|nr:hypothetical protein [Acidobacteriota bacterium]
PKEHIKISKEAAIASTQSLKEKQFWLNNLEGEWTPGIFPYDNFDTRVQESPRRTAEECFKITGELFSRLIRVSGGNAPALHMLLTTALMILISKYSGSTDFVIVSPIDKQDIEGDFVNTLLPLRIQVDENITFKELLLQVKDTIDKAIEHQNYPIEVLIHDHLGISFETGLPFDVAILLENIQSKMYLKQTPFSLIFSFFKTDSCIEGIIEYNPSRYLLTTIQRIMSHFKYLLLGALFNANSKLANLEVLSEEEKKQLLWDFNHPGENPAVGREIPCPRGIHELFTEQVERTPGLMAVVYYEDLSVIYETLYSGIEHISADRLALFEKCRFKKNPYIFVYTEPGTSVKTILEASQVDTSWIENLKCKEEELLWLQTQIHNDVVITQGTLDLLEGFTGEVNLVSLFTMLKEKKGNPEYLVYDIKKKRMKDGRLAGGELLRLETNKGFNDFILLIKELFQSHLVELINLSDYSITKNIPFPTVAALTGADHRKPSRQKSPVTILLLGDTIGAASTGLLYLASYLRRNGIDAVCQSNDRVRKNSLLKPHLEKLLSEFQPKIVGVSMKWFTHIARALEICKIIKTIDPTVKVVIGGNTGSFFGENLIDYEYVDMVVRGDGEVPLLKICRGEDEDKIPNIVYKKNGQMIINPITYVQDENNSSDVFLSHLDEIFISDLEPYLNDGFYINTGKGCSQRCFYCGGCRDVQVQTFNRGKPFLRGTAEVQKDIEAALDYTSTFIFDFDLPLYGSVDYYKKIWEGIDLSRHFCQFYFWKLPSVEFISLVARTFKYAYLMIDVGSLSEDHRKKLESLGLVKPQPTDDELFSFFDTCETYRNIEVHITQIAGLPYFSLEDIGKSNAVLARIMARYSCFRTIDWGRLHAQPGAPLVTDCEKYGMVSYARTFEDFLYFSQLNLKEEAYPDLEKMNYPYIYWKDDRMNSEIGEYYSDTAKKIAGHREKLEKSLFLVRTATYKELEDRTYNLAVLLQEKGVISGDIVALMVEKPIHAVYGILGILKAGAAYLPIDPDYPGDRIRYMLKDSGAKIIVVSKEVCSAELNCQCLIVNDEGLISAPRASFNPSSSILHSSSQLAYVIYTSGSTGRPKGVAVEHKNAFNTLLARKEAYKMDHRATALQLFSYAFDGFVTSFFTPVISGARIVLLSGEEVRDISRIRNAILENKVSHFIAVPALFKEIAENLEREELASLEVVVLAGDKLQPSVLEKVREKNKIFEIVNEYGVTEAAVMSTLFRHQEQDQIIKIGRPIWNTNLYILDRHNHPLPIGSPGELCISGLGVARGYLNNPELTAERFIKNVISPSSLVISSIKNPSSDQCPMNNDRLYKTGDLARWLADGNIEFLGRIDTQVKIRGFRVELGEIENLLITHESIKEAVVLDNQGNNDNKYFCAYLVPVDGKKVDIPGIKTFLLTHLPVYMIPLYLIELDKIPLTMNGKIDKNALLKLEENRLSLKATFTPPGTEMEKEIANVWKEVLQTEQVDIDDNFFDIGGNSINIIKVEIKLEKFFNREIAVVDLFRYTTIRSLAQYFNQGENRQAGGLTPEEKMDNRIDIMQETSKLLLGDEED